MIKRLLLFFWILLTLALVGGTAYFYLQYNSLRMDVARLRVVEDVNSPLEMQVVQQQILLDSLDRSLAKLKAEYESDSSIQIQLGMFQNFDLSLFQKQYQSIVQEEKDGMHVILMRGFTSIDSAELALQKLKTLGFKGAFIVDPSVDSSLINGQPSTGNEATF